MRPLAPPPDAIGPLELEHCGRPTPTPDLDSPSIGVSSRGLRLRIGREVTSFSRLNHIFRPTAKNGASWITRTWMALELSATRGLHSRQILPCKVAKLAGWGILASVFLDGGAE